MKNLVFRELLLSSSKERAARKVEFDPEMTVIQGSNDTGKSSLIKSLFTTFGCKPKVNANWTALGVFSVVRFTVDRRSYAMVRAGNRYGLFQGNDLVKATSRVTEELAPALAEILDFKLQLPTRDTGKGVTPPPAFYFLPFYIDQDNGWTKSWNSFEGLQQFQSPKKDLAEYHVGIFPNEYYVQKVKRTEAEAKLDEPKMKERILRNLQRDMEKRYQSVPLDLDVEVFRREVDALLERLATLKVKDEEYQRAVTGLRNVLMELEAQRALVERARGELDKDYELATESADHISCPTCGQEYENGILARFDFVHDVAQCTDTLAVLATRIEETKLALRAEEQKLREARTSVADVNKLLEVKKGHITLKELIENEGRKGFARALDRDLKDVELVIGELDAAVRTLKDNMAKFEDRHHRRAITGEYAEQMDSLCSQLNVTGLPASVLKRVDATLDQTTGSDLPRALLAYSFALWRVIAKHGSSVFPPLVIDAVNQQEQDRSNLAKMLKVIRDGRPEGTQCIIGVVDTLNTQFPGKRIDVSQKYGLLQESEFASVEREVRRYVDRILR